MKLIKATSMAIALLLTIFTATAQTTQGGPVQGREINLPAKFIPQTERKVNKYYSRITNKTEKTLAKLSKWENKIHSILQKANPRAAARLFDNQLTFTALLEKYKQGEAIATQYGRQYDEYRDKLNGTVKYINQLKDSGTSKIAGLQAKLQKLDSVASNTEAIQQFIKERKQQLITQAMQYLGKSRYLQKINKESYYYLETLRNYKELFSDEQKAEELAKKLLQKIPGFNEFIQKNSVLASLFAVPGGGAGQSLAGLQTRASVQNLITQNFGSGPNAMQQLRDNVQAAQAQLNQLKDKIAQAGGGSSDDQLPDFKPNNQKTKTFAQRIVYDANIGFGKINSLSANTTADIAMGIGYKLNDKSTIGVGAGYKLGLGSIQRIRLSGQGINLRSYIDWKLKKQFYLSGGYEMNYLPALQGLSIPSPFGSRAAEIWQTSGLVGISKKMNVKTKWFKGTQIQLLYDMLYQQHRPATQPFVFRVGYSFK